MVKNVKIGLLKIIFVLFTGSVFMPYISPIPVPAVTQPMALFFALSYLILSNRKSVHKNLFLTIVPLLVVFLFSIGSLTKLTTIRSLVGYFSLFSISSAAYICFKNDKRNNILLLEKTIKSITWIWFIFGAVQLITDVDYATFFKYSIGFEVSSDRGVTSLATEPSYYGTVCVFIYIFMTAINRIDNLYRSLLIFQIIVFAQSPISILYLFIYYFLKLFFEADIKKRIIYTTAFILVGVLIAKFIDVFASYRIGYLFGKILNNPGSLVLVDQSLNHRFQHFYFSLLGSFENYFLPQNISEWGAYYDKKAVELYELVIWNPNTPNRIMSGYGSLFFEVGLLGLSIPICVYLACSQFFSSKKKIFTYAFFFNVVMFSAIPIAFPVFGFIIGFLFSNREDSYVNN